MITSLRDQILQEVTRLGRQLRPSSDIASAVDLLTFAHNIQCEATVANCLRFISSRNAYSSVIVSNGSLENLSTLLEQQNVELDLRFKLMGLILKREMKELVPHPTTEKKEAWEDVMTIANELIKFKM